MPLISDSDRRVPADWVSSRDQRGLLFVEVHGLLIAVASLVAACGL